VPQNLLRVSFLGFHFSFGVRKHELTRGVSHSVLKVWEQCCCDWEHVRVLPFCRIGIVGAADDDKTSAQIHILSPEAEQFAFAHSSVDGSCEEVAPVIGYVKEQERNLLSS
jgi:hypothetical protein